jgi:N-acetylmuramoyl-L-alanine amidase
MDYVVKNHRMTRGPRAVEQAATPNKGGAVTPEVIVLHDTAGRLDHVSSVRWLCDPAARASAHFVVGRAGEVVQLAPTNVSTWHAGASNHGGRANVNGFSVGIEIVNPGIMQSAPGGGARAWFGQVFPVADHGIEHRATPQHGAGLWMPYTEAQVDTVTALCLALRAAYPSIAALTTHWAISPGRKVDTNPLFPLDAVRARVMGRQDAPSQADDTDAVTTVGVNLRRWPSLADNVIEVLARGRRVRIVRSGVFTNGEETARWFLVATGDNEGWVHGTYLDLD